MTSARRLLVGSYTATSGGHATGISLVEPPIDGGGSSGTGASVARTIAVLDDPSFLAVSGDRVYAVTESDSGGVHAFRFDGTDLAHLWDAPSGGDAPCHLRVDPSGMLMIANYLSGTVTAIDLETTETHLASVRASDAVVLSHTSGDRTAAPATAMVTVALPDVTGPVADRQEGPHAHQTVPSDRGTILVADLGGDTIHEFLARTGDDGPVLECVARHRVAPGTGPRHMVWHDGDLFVSGELDGAVHRLRRTTDGGLVEVTSVSAAPGNGADILLSHVEAAGGLLYAAVRGRDTIAVLDPSDGGLAFVADVGAGGRWPRHFAIADGRVFVANERSDSIAVLPIGADGIPGAPEELIAVGSPTCVIPLD